MSRGGRGKKDASFYDRVAVAYDRKFSFFAVFFREAEQLGIDGFKFRVRAASAAGDAAGAKTSACERYGAIAAFLMRQMPRISAYCYGHERGSFKK